MNCPECGYSSVPEGARFCPNCRAEIPETARRSTLITSEQMIGSVEGGKAIGVIIDAVTGDVTIETVHQSIGTFVQQALSAVEEAEQAKKIEAQHLAQGVSAFVQRLEDLASRAVESGNPYKGLLEYRLSDAEIFFGRSQAIQEFAQALQLPGSLTILHAESGAGKTSLLQAGIAPRLLAAGNLPIHIRPYNVNPAVEIKRAFIPDLDQTPQLKDAPLRDFLHRVCTILGKQTKAVIFVDQFEEFFTQLDEPERETFVRELAECLSDETLNVRWVLALRSEFFSQLATFRPRIRDPFKNDYRLSCLTRAEAQDVTLRPAERRGVQFEAEVVEALLDELSKDEKGEIAPSQIQLVCSLLYAELKPAEHTITWSLYEQQGKAKGILRDYLERVLNRDLPPEQRTPARHLLEELVTSDGQRALCTRSELIAELARWNVTPETLDTILDQLVDSRLLLVHEGSTDGADLAYELVHDYLLGEIELDPEVQARKAAQELLERGMRDYHQYGTLIDEERFEVIEKYQDELRFTSEAEQLFAESQMAVQKERTARVWRTRWLAVGLAVTVVLAVWAWGQRNVALQQQEIAEAARQIATSRQLAAQSTNQLNDHNWEVAILLAIEAGRVADTAEAFAALRQAFARPEYTRVTLSGHESEVVQAAWNSDESRILTASWDGTARVWDAETGEELLILSGHTNQVKQAVWNRDESRILTVSLDGTARVWDAETGEELLILSVRTRLYKRCGTLMRAIS